LTSPFNYRETKS